MFDQNPLKDPVPRLLTSPMWNAAYRKYFRLWTNLARGADLSEDEAKDVVQTIIIAILSEPSRRFQSMEHVRNYVAKSVLNRVKVVKARNARKSGWEAKVESRFAVLPDESPGDDWRRRTALRKAIRWLSRKDFNILKLRFYSGFTLVQVGEILSMPVSTVKSREEVILRKIRERLRKNGF